jgi:hypothetical protein
VLVLNVPQVFFFCFCVIACVVVVATSTVVITLNIKRKTMLQLFLLFLFFYNFEKLQNPVPLIKFSSNKFVFIPAWQAILEKKIFLLLQKSKNGQIINLDFLYVLPPLNHYKFGLCQYIF